MSEITPCPSCESPSAEGKRCTDCAKAFWSPYGAAAELPIRKRELREAAAELKRVTEDLVKATTALEAAQAQIAALKVEVAAVMRDRDALQRDYDRVEEWYVESFNARDAAIARAEAAEAQAAAMRTDIGELLAENGCDCDCEHHSDDHTDDCDRCLACRVSAVLMGTDAGRALLERHAAELRQQHERDAIDRHNVYSAIRDALGLSPEEAIINGCFRVKEELEAERIAHAALRSDLVAARQLADEYRQERDADRALIDKTQRERAEARRERDALREEVARWERNAITNYKDGCTFRDRLYAAQAALKHAVFSEHTCPRTGLNNCPDCRAAAAILDDSDSAAAGDYVRELEAVYEAAMVLLERQPNLAGMSPVTLADRVSKVTARRHRACSSQSCRTEGGGDQCTDKPCYCDCHSIALAAVDARRGGDDDQSGPLRSVAELIAATENPPPVPPEIWRRGGK